MSYFNPKIFNRENLNDQDRAKLDYWHDEFDNVIENAFDDFESTGSTTADKIKREFIADFCDTLRERLGEALQDNLVSFIDGYRHEVKEREEYTDYLYDPEDDGDD